MGEGVKMSNFIQFFWMAYVGIYGSEVSNMFIPIGSVISTFKNRYKARIYRIVLWNEKQEIT